MVLTGRCENRITNNQTFRNSYLFFIAADIKGELDGTVRAKVGAGAVAGVLHVVDNLIGSLMQDN